MQVTLDLPEDLARLIGGDPRSLTRAAIEALALEGLRSQKLSVSQARRLLGISRYEMDGFLKAHGILLHATLDEVQHDADTAQRFLNR